MESSHEAYERTLDYLYSFINFEKQPADRYQASKIDAERPRRLLAILDNPHLVYPSIHIAGTKGKGSVAVMSAACLTAAGLRVGLYTSPHLRDLRERIRVITPQDPDGSISQGAFVSTISQIRPSVEEMGDSTWYEIMTAAAFLYFRQMEIDIAIVEVGLGGRLDATNVLLPEASVITSLSLDHTQLLGDTLPQIAFEKGGIIKPGVPAILAQQSDEAMVTLESICAEREAPAIVIGRDWHYSSHKRPGFGGALRTLVILDGPDPVFIPANSEFPLALAGEYQLENATLALAALEQVHDRFPSLDLDALRSGLATVVWPGRLQILQYGPNVTTVLVDSAHNADSAARLREALHHDFNYDRLILTFGAPADKDVDGMMAILFPEADEIIVTTANHPRSATPKELGQQARSQGYEPIITKDTGEALTAALELARPADLILVAGSIIVLGDWLNHWDDLQSKAS